MQLIQDKYNKLFQELHIVKTYKKELYQKIKLLLLLIVRINFLISKKVVIRLIYIAMYWNLKF